ncbi:MAG: hypothetical protein ACKO4S_10635, partial [Snowella sp.]
MLSKTFLKISAIAGIGVITTASMANSQTKELTGTLKKIKDSGVIVLGVRESSIPFSYLNDQQKPIG